MQLDRLKNEASSTVYNIYCHHQIPLRAIFYSGQSDKNGLLGKTSQVYIIRHYGRHSSLQSSLATSDSMSRSFMIMSTSMTGIVNADECVKTLSVSDSESLRYGGQSFLSHFPEIGFQFEIQSSRDYKIC